MTELIDIAIVGGGVTGYGAAVYTARFRLSTAVFAKEKGGLITWTHVVENYPGFKSLSGFDLAKNIWEHAESLGVKTVDEEVISVQRENAQSCFLLQTKSGKQFHAKTVLFATGTKVKQLGKPGEETFKNKGVHYCATCDGALYGDKVIAVIGGSDSAAKEALLLSEYASKVYLIHRGNEIRPEPINAERVKQNKKIEVILNTNVTELKGDKFLSHAVLDKPFRGNNELKLDAVFIAIGHIPLSEVSKKLGVAVTDKGYIKINRVSETSVPGVFAAGDVADTEFKQAITGVAEGVWAAYSAFKYVKNTEIRCV